MQHSPHIGLLQQPQQNRQMGKWVSRLLSLGSVGCGEEGRVSGARAGQGLGEAQEGVGALTIKPASAPAASWACRAASCPVCGSRRGGEEGQGPGELSDLPPHTGSSPRVGVLGLRGCPGSRPAVRPFLPSAHAALPIDIPDLSPSLPTATLLGDIALPGLLPPPPGTRLPASCPIHSVPHALAVGLKACGAPLARGGKSVFPQLPARLGTAAPQSPLQVRSPSLTTPPDPWGRSPHLPSPGPLFAVAFSYPPQS